MLIAFGFLVVALLIIALASAGSSANRGSTPDDHDAAFRLNNRTGEFGFNFGKDRW